MNAIPSPWLDDAKALYVRGNLREAFFLLCKYLTLVPNDRQAMNLATQWRQSLKNGVVAQKLQNAPETIAPEAADIPKQ